LLVASVYIALPHTTSAYEKRTQCSPDMLLRTYPCLARAPLEWIASDKQGRTGL
jgi:hypothetical protein